MNGSKNSYNLLNSFRNCFGGGKVIFKCFDSDLESIYDNLKDHYQNDLELIEKHWDKFDVCGILNLETFYCQNIVISDKYQRLEKQILNYDDLFSTSYKRIVVYANAGYGKSIFVHEMARRWMKRDGDWTKKFDLLFLFRLGEVSVMETKTFQTLLAKCVSEEDSQCVIEWLSDKSNLRRCLFIFDGLDELQHSVCKEINNLIYGNGIQHAHVVVTTRPGRQFAELKNGSSRNLYIQLKGFTEEGTKQQLQKFGINSDNIKKSISSTLKVPLFNTLFCITHEESNIAPLNLCLVIEKFIKFTFNRHRKSNELTSNFDEHELILTLGKVAQNKFSFMRGIPTEYVNVTNEILNIAIDTGLVLRKSTEEDLLFTHYTIAEYCAAYFWFKSTSLKVEKVCLSVAYFEDPSKSICSIDGLFSSFLSHFNPQYKLSLWKNFDANVPVFDSYKDLKKRLPAITSVLSRYEKIDAFFKMVCSTYRKHNQSFGESEENNLIFLFGQAAQNKFNFMKGPITEYPLLTKQLIMIAVRIGLIDPRSSEDDITFVEYDYGSYCAAYYWLKTSHLKVERVSSEYIHFADSPKRFCLVNHSFSLFLSTFDSEFRSHVMKYFATYYPYVQMERSEIYFSSHSTTEQKHILDKLDFSSNHNHTVLRLFGVHFKSVKKFDTLKNLQCILLLNNCVCNMDSHEFFAFYNFQWLRLFNCKFDDSAKKLVTNEMLTKSNLKSLPVLKSLSIKDCESILPYLTSVTTHCTTLKTLYLRYSFKTDSDHSHLFKTKEDDSDWISALLKNKLLIESITQLQLTFDNSPNLTNIFEMSKEIKNLTSFNLTLSRALLPTENDALSKTFEVGLKRLEILSLDILPGQYSSFVKNIGKLCNLKTLEINHKYFTVDSFCALINIFENIKLEGCKLSFQEQLFFSSDLLDAIKFCDSLKKITFMVVEKNEKLFQTFEDQILSMHFVIDRYHCGDRQFLKLAN